MDTYVTEEQQVEEIKKWWRENGSSVVSGAALGLALVFGWRTWNDWHEGKSEAASTLYQQIIVPKADPTLIQAVGTRLMEEYPASSYAALGALAQAGSLVEKGDLGSAQGRLEWIILHAADNHLKGLAQLRLGWILLEQGDTSRAQTLSDAALSSGFPAEAAELRGDILLRQGDKGAARRAFLESLAKLPSNSRRSETLRIKIDDLAK